MDNINELQHHGIKGQRWGIRRYQNADGTLTPAGKKREAKLDRQMAKQAYKYNQLKKKKLSTNSSDKEEQKEDIHKKKNVTNMSDAELREKASRLELENRYVSAITTYNKLNPKQVSKGRAFADKVLKDVVTPVAIEVGKNATKNMLESLINDMAGEKTNKKK